MASPPAVWNKCRKWCRLVILLHAGGKTLLKDLLNKLGVDITDGAEISWKLEPQEQIIKTKTVLPTTSVFTF